MIATTDFYGSHSEVVKIKTISGTTIDFEPALKYKHISVVETHGGKKLKMKAEIGMLTRNIVIQGNPQDSLKDEYGGHVIIHGRADQGSIARISHVEFRYTG